MKRASHLEANAAYCPKCGRPWERCSCFDLAADVKAYAQKKGWPVVELKPERPIRLRKRGQKIACSE